MHVSKYQLYVNITSKGEQYVIRTMQFNLDAFKIFPASAHGAHRNQIRLAAILLQMMKDKQLDRVPDNTPFYLGFVIVSEFGHTCGLDNLVKALMEAMQGVVYMDKKLCDGISVIRDRDGEVNDCRIHVAWKVDPPKKTSDKHPFFSRN